MAIASVGSSSRRLRKRTASADIDESVSAIDHSPDGSPVLDIDEPVLDIDEPVLDIAVVVIEVSDTAVSEAED